MRKHWQSRSACRYAVTSVSVYTPEALDESGYEALDEPALDEQQTSQRGMRLQCMTASYYPSVDRSSGHIYHSSNKALDKARAHRSEECDCNV